MTASAPPLPAHRFAKPSGILLVIYWTGLFIGTHTPRVSGIDFSVADKVLHFGAYFGLALLLALAWSLRRPLAARGYAVMAVLLLAYGVLDELLQIPVGRHGDPLDWLADACGVMTGLALFWAVGRGLPRRNEPPRGEVGNDP